MERAEVDFAPPPGPPPLLNLEQLVHLATQGWVILPSSRSSILSQSYPLSCLTRSLSSLFPLLSGLFDQPVQVKRRSYPPKQGTEFGYYRIENEKEYLTLRSRVHADNELEKAAAAVWADAATLLQRILYDIANGLVLEPDIWNNLLDGTLALPENEKAMSSGTLLRLFLYEAGKGFAGAHSDLGLLTLCAGDQKGLQVLDRQTLEQGGPEKWTDVGPGEMVVLVGQTVRALTDGRLRAGVHRVIASEQQRHSVVFALRHSWRHDIDMERFGGEGRLESKRLWEALKIGVVNINAPRALRDKQRLKLDRLKEKVEERGQG